jgi:hypothetical protein
MLNVCLAAVGANCCVHAGPACNSALLQFPYYTFIDRSKMYSIGSLFYAIYFFVSFPMFMRLDEQVAGRRWSLREVRGRSLSTGSTLVGLLGWFSLPTALNTGPAKEQACCLHVTESLGVECDAGLPAMDAAPVHTL